MLLSIENVIKKYGSQEVLHNISFSVNRGEIIGFLGPNGAGKSTTMKIISGCIPADAGTIMINGRDMNKQPIEAKARLGYLPEDNPLYDEMYIKEYLEYVLTLYPEKKDIKKRISDIIELTGLSGELRKTIGKLSKGYKQRVGLAQAIIHDPEVLILDEATSGLDPNQLEGIMSLIKSLSAEKAVLLSSHTLSEIKSICTRIILIHKGMLVADKAMNEIEDLELLFKELTTH
jgi:ABC-type multidrug transport system, ATPase component